MGREFFFELLPFKLLDVVIFPAVPRHAAGFQEPVSELVFHEAPYLRRTSFYPGKLLYPALRFDSRFWRSLAEILVDKVNVPVQITRLAFPARLFQGLEAARLKLLQV